MEALWMWLGDKQMRDEGMEDKIKRIWRRNQVMDKGMEELGDKDWWRIK